MDNDYHIPVLLNESVEGLLIKPNGFYADVTFGGGGHSKVILNKLEKGKLIAFDQDPDAVVNANRILESEKYKEKFIFYKSNFKYLQNFIKYSGYEKIDGIIADLGVSSHQFNEKGRGFSFMLGGKPDMRMNNNMKSSAMEILNNYKADELFFIFKTYGELKSASKLTDAIILNRDINSLEELNSIVSETIKTKRDYKILAKVYQALRIETNKEIEVLKELLLQCSKVLKKGGRLVVISYHSLEDRIVKNYLKHNNFEGLADKNIYGIKNLEFKEITKKAILPSEEEIKINSRARSAKLRIAEKI